MNKECWYGGCCEAPATFTISGGHSVFGRDTRHCCEAHLAPMITYMTRPVPGWGHALPCVVQPGIVEALSPVAPGPVGVAEALRDTLRALEAHLDAEWKREALTAREEAP